MSHGLAMAQIIIKAQSEMKDAQVKLETEEGAKEVAALQGRVAGYKILTSALAAVFHLTESFIQGLGRDPVEVQKLTDDDFELLRHSVETLRISEEWKALLERIAENKEKYKEYLLFAAEKTRDLVLTQAKYGAQTIYNNFFETIESDNKRRRRERENREKLKAESLPFDELHCIDPLATASATAST